MTRQFNLSLTNQSIPDCYQHDSRYVIHDFGEFLRNLLQYLFRARLRSISLLFLLFLTTWDSSLILKLFELNLSISTLISATRPSPDVVLFYLDLKLLSGYIHITSLWCLKRFCEGLKGLDERPWIFVFTLTTLHGFYKIFHFVTDLFNLLQLSWSFSSVLFYC